MTVGNRSGVKRYTLGTPNRKRISKVAARGHKKGVVDQCFADPKVKTYVVHKVLQILQSKMKAMCSLQVGSILRDNTSDGIKVFNWNSFIGELKKMHHCCTRFFALVQEPSSQGPIKLGLLECALLF